MTNNFKNSQRNKALFLFAVFSFLLFSGCSSTMEKEDSSFYTVTIENQSDTDVYEISYARGSKDLESGGGMYADGSPMGKGDDFSFTFEEKPGALHLSFLDGEKNILVVSSIVPSFEDTMESTFILTSVQGKLILEQKKGS